jgi:hypothetical protein
MSQFASGAVLIDSRVRARSPEPTGQRLPDRKRFTRNRALNFRAVGACYRVRNKSAAVLRINFSPLLLAGLVNLKLFARKREKYNAW